MKTADAKTTPAVKHLSSDHIDTIALDLDLDVYGANGDLDDGEIKKNLIENIHARTDYAYADTGLMPVWHVADLIRSVWEHKDREHKELMAEAANAGFTFPPLPDVPDLNRRRP
jgi:hypothetical protein